MCSATAAESERDGALLARMNEGDQGAFDALRVRYEPAMLAASARLCGRHDAQEVVQDVWARLWFHGRRFDASRGSLRGFLLLEIRSRSIDLLRRHAARNKREVVLTEDSDRDDDGALRQMREVEVRHQLVDLLADLSPQERESLLFAFIGGYTYREVAVRLGLPEGTVKSRIRSALARLVRSIELDEDLERESA